MPRIVKAGLIQASTTHPGSEDPTIIRDAMIAKHVAMIEEAAGKGALVQVTGVFDQLTNAGDEVDQHQATAISRDDPEGLDAGTISQKQASSLITTLHGHQPINLHIEKIGRKLWVTLLSKRQTVWTWSIGAMGKATSPNLDTSESNMNVIEALNTKA